MWIASVQFIFLSSPASLRALGLTLFHSFATNPFPPHPHVFVILRPSG